MFLGQLSTTKLITFAAKQSKQKKRNVKLAAIEGVGAAYVAQKTVRSGIPRLLGVRLESHSTSHKNANTILQNGGIIDPAKSGSGAIRALETNAAGLGTDINLAKNKVYITGIHKNAIAREMPNPYNRFLTVTVDPKKEGPLTQVQHRSAQRRGYRGQSTINWDYVNKDTARLQELNKQVTKGYAGELRLPTQQLADEYTVLQTETAKRLQQERGKAVLKGLLPTTGRSLYLGGSDKYFNTNFKPDFDDPRAMYAENKIKVYGNRLKATAAAIREEGLLNLVKNNPKRVLAGAVITGLGGTIATSLTRKAIQNSTGDVKVKDFYRKGKMIKGYSRKKSRK